MQNNHKALGLVRGSFDGGGHLLVDSNSLRVLRVRERKGRMQVCMYDNKQTPTAT